MTGAERETVIQWDEESKQVSLYSCVKSVWRKAERAGWSLERTWNDAAGREISREYVAPLALFRFTCLNARSAESARQKRSAATKARMQAGWKPGALTLKDK